MTNMLSLFGKGKGVTRFSCTSFVNHAFSYQTQLPHAVGKFSSTSTKQKPISSPKHTPPTRLFNNLATQPTITQAPPPPPTTPYKTPTPPGYETTPILRLQTLILPTTSIVEKTLENITLANQLIFGLRQNNIVQFALTPAQETLQAECIALSKAFFSLPYAERAKHVDPNSFAGYIASGEEITSGKPDFSEIFTITKDLPLSDERVQENWPCHDPTPWPSQLFAQKYTELLASLSETGEVVLQLLAMGLGLRADFFKELTRDGWHHARVLKFKPWEVDEEGMKKRGIGAHTDYGLLVLALSEPINSVFFQMRDGEWKLLEQKEGTMTCFPGDMLQLLTNDLLMSTPHKVALNTTDRFAIAYFHEPNFDAVVEPAKELADIGNVLEPIGGIKEKGKVHYGTHFTGKFMNNYSKRVTAKRILETGSLDILEKLKKEAFARG